MCANWSAKNAQIAANDHTTSTMTHAYTTASLDEDLTVQHSIQTGDPEGKK